MLLDTSDFKSLPGIVEARLSESCDGPSILTLGWRGFGPEWMRRLEPVTVMHCGRVLYHGRITAYERSNDANNIEASCTVSNALWLLDNLPLGAQVAEARAAKTNTASSSINSAQVVQSVSFRKAGQEALQSWETLAESCRVSAPLWVVNDDGEPQENGVIWLDVERANYSSGAVFNRDKAITTWTALLEMKSANPDATFRMNYTTGAVEAVAIENADVVTWDADAMELASCVGISPQYDSCVTGVALVVMWDGGSVLRVYPDSVEPGDMGVKLFSATVESSKQAERQAEYMMRQLRHYYNAVNTLQHGGSITAMLNEVQTSPLCRRMNIAGAGTHESWHDMAAVVSAVEWDFLDGIVEVQLGAQIDEPDISEMTFPEDSGGDDGDDGDDSSDDGGGWNDDFSDESEEESEAPGDDSTTWDNTTTWDDTTQDDTTQGDTTQDDTTQDDTTQDDTTQSQGGSTTTSGEPSETGGSDPDNPDPDSTDDTTTARWTTTAPWSTGMLSTTGGSEQESEPGSTPGSEPGSSPGSSPGSNPGSSPGGGSQGGGSQDGDDGTDRWTTTSPWTKGSDPGSTPGSSPGSSPGSDPGSSPGSSPGSDPGSTPGTGCSCDEKWTQNEERLKAIETRLDALEGAGDNTGGDDTGDGGSGSHPCQYCKDTQANLSERITALEEKIKALESGTCSCVEQVKSAINDALSGSAVSLGGSASQEVQQNANGTITVTASWRY